MKSAELEVLDELIARSRTRLQNSVEDVGTQLERATDCSARVREHPWASLGIAASVGTLAGALAGKTWKGRSKSARSNASFAGRQLLTALRLLVVQELLRSGDTPAADSSIGATSNSKSRAGFDEVSPEIDYASL